MAVAAIGAPVTPLAAQGRSARLSRADAEDVRRLIASVDRAMTGPAGADELHLRWLPHTLRSPEGQGYVPFTLVIDDLPETVRSAALYVRVARRGDVETSEVRHRALAPVEYGGELPLFAYDAAARSSAVLRLLDKSADVEAYPLETVYFLDLAAEAQQGRAVVRRALPLGPGSYDVYLALRERESSLRRGQAAREGLLKAVLDVPDFASAALTLSSVLIADDMLTIDGPLTPAEQAERPYAMGATEFVPALDADLSQTETLSVVSFLENVAADQDGKPDVSVAYRFYRVTAEGEQFFNAASPQKYNVHSLPDVFDLRAGHRLVPAQAVPLASFPPGPYRLEIRIDDYVAGESVAGEVRFNVLPSR